MAERRMFAKTIIDSDAFLDMSASAQALYFHLGMRADDEGFVNNPKKIQRMMGTSDDDIKILIAKKFIIPFESGIVVIKHWKIHNYIRGDRIQETKYHREKQMLALNENDAYTLNKSLPCEEVKNLPEGRTVRQKAYDESSLPYSFDYKIRNAFIGKPCPICGAVMEIDKEFGVRNRIPSIHHNIPVSMGGEHELGNISVICKQCNVSIQDKPTDSMNADEVVTVWESLTGKCQASDGQMTDKCQASDGQMTDKCQASDGQMTDKCQASDGQATGECQHRLGKDRLGKDRLESTRRFTPPSLTEVQTYCTERNNAIDPQRFIDFYESKGWLIGKNKMKDWKAAIRNWESRDAQDKPKEPDYTKGWGEYA